MGRTEILTDVYHYAKTKLDKPFVPGKTYIPPSGPKLHPEDIQTLADAVLEMWYTEWKYSERFKNDLTRFLGYHPRITLCNSGSSASLLAMSAAKEKWGNERKPYVITCASNFPTTITPIYNNDFLPFYIDIDPATLSPNLEQLDFALSRYWVKGVFLAHNLGLPFDEKAVKACIGSLDVWFCVDNCDALGAQGKDQNSTGYHADMSICSFFPAHQITAGEGGYVACKDDGLHRIIESLSNWGRSCYCHPGQQNTCGHRFDWSECGFLPEGWDHKYIFDRPGYNLKMTDLQAALGLSQLSHIRDFTEARIANYYALLYALKDCEHLELVRVEDGVYPSPFGFPILVREDAPFSCQEMIAYLEAHKVGTRRLFAGNIVCQPGFMNLQHNKLDLSGSERVMRQMFWISCAPFLTPAHIDYMLNVIHDFLGKY